MDLAQRSLSGHSYRSADVYERERERIFHRSWFMVGPAERVAEAGQRSVVQVAGESILVVRGRDDVVRAFHNVCRHRGAVLCEPGEEESSGAITCPYHGWSYSLKGDLIGTPLVGKEEVDRSEFSLAPVTADVWQGLVFVCLHPDPPPLRDWLASQRSEPSRFERFDLATRRSVRTTVAEVEANWKILVENYCECLHCTRVHPELVELIPTYRSGSTQDPTRTDHGVGLARDSEMYERAGYAALAAAAGSSEDDPDEDSYFGASIFPNVFLDVTGASVVVSTLLPRGPEHTTVVADYLFTPRVLETPGFDPTDIIDFNELVARQDFAVCERVQRGIASRSFAAGVYAKHDVYARGFALRYLEEMEGVPGLAGPVSAGR
jgi:glycine betaine catabolism A